MSTVPAQPCDLEFTSRKQSGNKVPNVFRRSFAEGSVLLKFVSQVYRGILSRFRHEKSAYYRYFRSGWIILS